MEARSEEPERIAGRYSSKHALIERGRALEHASIERNRFSKHEWKLLDFGRVAAVVACDGALKWACVYFDLTVIDCFSAPSLEKGAQPPLVMALVSLTPDYFAAHKRLTEEGVCSLVKNLVE